MLHETSISRAPDPPYCRPSLPRLPPVHKAEYKYISALPITPVSTRPSWGDCHASLISGYMYKKRYLMAGGEHTGLSRVWNKKEEKSRQTERKEKQSRTKNTIKGNKY